MRKLIAVALLLSSFLSVATRAQNAATPVITPASGSYSGSTLVTITDSTPSVVIYYTLDGSVPTNASTKYTGPFTVSGTTTVSAIAIVPQSAVASASYTIVVPPTTYPYLVQPNPAVLNYSWQIGTAAPVSQNVQVGDSSPCPAVAPVPLCHWPVTVSTDHPWLIATPATGGTTSFVANVSVNPSSITAAGVYTANVIFTQSQFQTSVVKLPVTITVTAATLPPVCVPPAILINGVCTLPPPSLHKVTLSWDVETGVAGYNIYRGVSGGALTKVNSMTLTSPLYIDTSVSSGTYVYAATAVDVLGNESGKSVSLSVTVP